MTKRTSIRIPMTLWAWLADRAKREGRTVSNLVIYLLDQARLSGADRDATPLHTADGSQQDAE